MNVSMMDSYNLAWKLVHSIHGLTPSTASGVPDPVLETFELERVDIARQLIDFDTKFSHMFSGKISSEDPSKPGLTHDEFLRVFSEGSGFTSGCGLQYHPSRIVKPSETSSGAAARGPSENLEHGYITPGKRLLNVELKRYADGSTRQLHDGKFSADTRGRTSKSTQSNLTRSNRNRILRPLHPNSPNQQRPPRPLRSLPQSSTIQLQDPRLLPRRRHRSGRSATLDNAIRMDTPPELCQGAR